MLRAGLTGGIASGKSTVAGFLAELGAFVQDGDRIAHEVMEPGGPAYESVVERFGRDVLDEDGSISRPRLGAVVFADDDARADLNALVHPEVRREAERRLQAYLAHGRAVVVVLEAALLVETGAYRDHDTLIVVKCGPEAQVQRMVARGMSLDDARARLDAQAPLADKLALARYVIDTETSMRITREQTRQVYESMLQEFERKFGDSRR